MKSVQTIQAVREYTKENFFIKSVTKADLGQGNNF